MAGDQEKHSSDDLSDEISQHRLQEYRRKGMVSQSRELSSLLGMFAGFLLLLGLSSDLTSKLKNYLSSTLSLNDLTKLELDPKVLLSHLSQALMLALSIFIPISGLTLGVGMLASFIQVGPIFSQEPLFPDFSKIDPLQGFRRLFSMRHLLESVRLFFKSILLLALGALALKPYILKAPWHLQVEPNFILAISSQMGSEIFFTLFFILTLFAVGDFFFQKWEYRKGLRLTKQEAKQEHKEKEGDPQIKARIRSVQREIARRRMMQAVKKSDVIITNPTHFAVALSYDRKKMTAPRVVAKGADFLAQKIREVAEKSSIPRVENVALARTLYHSVKVGHSIPHNLYQAVAEVLAYVYKLRNIKR